jgi:hypothetical protein
MGMGLVGWFVRDAVGTALPLRQFWHVALQLGATFLAGGCVFVFLAWLLRSEDLADVFSALKRRLPFQTTVVEGTDEARGS